MSGLLLSLVLSPAFGQGPLLPPGPPAPTMKTLDQAEPRTPITSLPFTIDSPGSYYFTGNLEFTATSGPAITIAASGVTLDLMGFKLSSTSAVMGNGIALSPGVRDVEIRNGVIAGTTTVTLGGGSPETWTVTPGGFNNGIDAAPGPEATNCQFKNLRISGCRLNGLDGGEEGLVDQVSASRNGTAGIMVDRGTVTNSKAFLNGGPGMEAGGGVVAHCSGDSNGGSGIVVLLGGSITNSSARRNGDNGIWQSQGVVAFCSARENNRKNNGSVDILAASPGTTRTGNNPTP